MGHQVGLLILVESYLLKLNGLSEKGKLKKWAYMIFNSLQ